MQNPLRTLATAKLKRAVEIREKIESLERELTRLLGIPEKLTLGHAVRTKRKMSAAVRAKIAGATKARWDRIRAAKKKNE
jgi:hypothetical protein